MLKDQCKYTKKASFDLNLLQTNKFIMILRNISIVIIYARHGCTEFMRRIDERMNS